MLGHGVDWLIVTSIHVTEKQEFTDLVVVTGGYDTDRDLIRLAVYAVMS